MLKHPYRSCALPDERRDLLGVEARDHAEKDYFGLRGREPSDAGQSSLVLARRNCLRLRIGSGEVDSLRGELRRGRAPSLFEPAKVDQPAAGNGEKPAPKGALVAGEALQPPGDVHPNVGGEIIAMGGRLGAKKA